MWVSKNADWNANHTELTRYFFEKIKQQVDYEEIISNTHRTTNGFTLIKELFDVAILTLKRRKSFRRLESLILESIDPLLTSNIANDTILLKYHSDIVDYYTSLKGKLKDDENLINDIRLKSKIFYLRLEKNYYENIKFEVRSIDFKSTKFARESQKIDFIITILIPYLLFIGYSPTSISNIAYKMISNSSGTILPIRFLMNFERPKISYEFLLITDPSLPEFNQFEKYFEKKEIKYAEVASNSVKLNGSRSLNIESGEKVFEFGHKCSDPHNFIRNLYEKTLRRHVLEHPRTSLSSFNSFFSKIYWRISIPVSHHYRTSDIKIDPINIEGRKATLLKTLRICYEKDPAFSSDALPLVSEIQDSVYYYNLAIGSKSIENSLMLLWSSLEALIPYRFRQTDIENVQHFVSKSLSIGSAGRLISSFATRLISSREFHTIDFKSLGIRPEIEYSPERFSYWAIWLGDDSKYNKGNDPYNTLKSVSNLLCKQYVYLNELYSGINDKFTVKDLVQKISSSKKSIEFQLDRIYLHRNQIVHSGKFINEYSNLWLHLEWYVGKLLAYCYIKFFEDPSHFDKEKAFMELEGDYDLVLNMLNKYSSKKVRELTFSFSKLFQHTWQFF